VQTFHILIYNSSTARIYYILAIEKRKKPLGYRLEIKGGSHLQMKLVYLKCINYNALKVGGFSL